MIRCEYGRCMVNEYDFDPKTIHLHHIIPKSINGADADGRMYVCKKHHDMLHNSLLKIIWPYVKYKESAKKAIQNYTKEIRIKKEGINGNGDL